MKTLYFETLTTMDRWITEFFSQVPAPRPIQHARGINLRFVEQTPQQAIIQKLARIISGLRASNLLLKTGFIQEQAALSRIVNELQDDVCFLAIAALEKPSPAILKQYLDAFYAEEETIGQWRARNRIDGRNQVPRRKILKFIANHSGPVKEGNISDAAIALNYAFSGYIHGASPHIMEMYDRSNGCFRTDAWPESPFRQAHEHDIFNYYYRGIIAFALAAKSFGNIRAMDETLSFLSHFENASATRQAL